jgi:hypothetical protein
VAVITCYDLLDKLECRRKLSPKQPSSEYFRTATHKTVIIIQAFSYTLAKKVWNICFEKSELRESSDSRSPSAKELIYRVIGGNRLALAVP